jgi:hypothetical protein
MLRRVGAVGPPIARRTASENSRCRIGAALRPAFRNLEAIDLGFEEDGTMAVTFLDDAAENLSGEQKIAFQEELARALPIRLRRAGVL